MFFLLQITQFLYNKKMNNPNISDKLVLIMLLVVKVLSASNFEYIFYSPLSLSLPRNKIVGAGICNFPFMFELDVNFSWDRIIPGITRREGGGWRGH